MPCCVSCTSLLVSCTVFLWWLCCVVLGLLRTVFVPSQPWQVRPVVVARLAALARLCECLCCLLLPHVSVLCALRVSVPL